MTGEMYAIDQDGHDSNGDHWPTHAAIAKALGGTLEPFDAYQGPYVLIGPDLRAGRQPYAATLPGPCRLWLQTDDGVIGQVYREDTDTLSRPFACLGDESEAIDAARELMHGRGTDTMTRCNEIISTWDGTKRYVCEAQRYTEHSHHDALGLGYARPLRPDEPTITANDCEYLDDGTRQQPLLPKGGDSETV